MKKYKVEVEITKEYEIEIDENLITEEMLDHFEKYFTKLNEEDDRYTSYVNEYCRLRAMLGERFIEGFGYAFEKGEIPFSAKFNNDKPNKGINLTSFDDEGDYYVNVREVE